MTATRLRSEELLGALLWRGWQRDRAPWQGELGGVEEGAGGGPGLGGELERAIAGPAREDAEQVAHVGLRVETAELTGGDERDEGAGPFSRFVASDEEPVGPADDEPAQFEFAPIIPRARLCRVGEVR